MQSKTDLIEQAMGISLETGVSKWWSIPELEARLGFALHGNGSPFFQTDRGLGVKYAIEKQRSGGNKLSFVRTVGFAPYHQTHRATGTSASVRKFLLVSTARCVMCGTATDLVPDHKDGNKQPLEAADVHDYQPMCRHCNTVKREVCKRCGETGGRFDARILGYSIPWTIGTRSFQPKIPRCRGCYWYSPVEFRKDLRLRQDG